MVALWLLIGCILVTITFFLPGQSSELWPNINSAGIALLLYLAALLGAFSRKQDITRLRKNLVLIAAVIAVAGAAFAWVQMEDQSRWQRERLGIIGSTIARGIYLSMIPDSLLAVLEAYHKQSGKTRKSLGQIYKERYPPGVPGDAWSSMEPSGRPNPEDDVFLKEISDTHVVLVARHPWYKGKEASFVNERSLTGTVQIRVTLTEKGIDYVTEN